MQTTTTTILLERLHDPANTVAWREFDLRYRPIVVGMCRRLGLNEDDAADAAQETLTRFLEGYWAGKYERGRGRLRSWIVGIAKIVVAELRSTRSNRRESEAGRLTEELSVADRFEELWDQEAQQAMVEEGMRQLREQTRVDARTIRAFEMTSFEQVPAAKVAEELGLSVDSVYAAKNRCMAHLRVILGKLNEIYEVG